MKFGGSFLLPQHLSFSLSLTWEDARSVTITDVEGIKVGKLEAKRSSYQPRCRVLSTEQAFTEPLQTDPLCWLRAEGSNKGCTKRSRLNARTRQPE